MHVIDAINGVPLTVVQPPHFSMYRSFGDASVFRTYDGEYSNLYNVFSIVNALHNLTASDVSIIGSYTYDVGTKIVTGLSVVYSFAKPALLTNSAILGKSLTITSNTDPGAGITPNTYCLGGSYGIVAGVNGIVAAMILSQSRKVEPFQKYPHQI